MTKHTYIMHIDGDNFFVACEVARLPHLVGKPVIVGEERGIASAMSKEAKKLGVTRGMPIFKIKKEFPQVTILPAHFDLYQHYSIRMASIVEEYSDSVEHYGIDECFGSVRLEIDKNEESFLEDYIRTLQDELTKTLGISFSIGIARTKTLAKVASKRNKPHGLCVITEKNRQDILAETPIESIWGIGRALSKRLLTSRVGEAGTFVALPESVVRTRFTKPTVDTYNELKGIQSIPLEHSSSHRKSLQTTRMMSPYSSERSFVFSEISRNVEIVCSRMRAMNLKSKKITFFIKQVSYHNDKRSIVTDGREVELELYTYNPSDIVKSIESIFNQIFDSSKKYRGTGITVHDLKQTNEIPLDLYNNQENKNKKESYTQVFDHLRKKFGSYALFIGSSMKSIHSRNKENDVRTKNHPYEYNLPLPYLGEVF
ncbi:MAG: polymerase [Patescibacteria group bacterium]|nr:polymerase [Patescibacteria group bacterium]